MMNNKKLGTAFEREFCEILTDNGYWVHFINPDRTGSQPFDVIAVKGGNAYAVDCKTCESSRFNINRLEDNQIFAFEKWLRCGNTQPMIAVKYKDTIRLVWYKDLKKVKSIPLEKAVYFRGDLCERITE